MTMIFTFKVHLQTLLNTDDNEVIELLKLARVILIFLGENNFSLSQYRNLHNNKR